MRSRSFLPRLPRGLTTGFICAALVAGATYVGVTDGAEGALLDRMFRARGVRSPDPRVTILVADDAAVARIGVWPLPRRIYADVITKLSQAGARTIALDILFSNHSPSKADDDLLAKACRDSKRVVQAAALHIPLIYNPVVPVTVASDRRPLPLRFAGKDEGAICRSATWASSALPELQNSAAAMGHINIHPELDGTLRRIPHLIRCRDRLYPSLSLAATANFLGLKPDDIVGKDQTVRLESSVESPDKKTRTLPLDENGEAWINWAGGNDTFPTYSFNQLLDGKVPPEALKDRLILVGVTAAGAFEHRATPFSPVQPAIELQANAVSDILTNRALVEVSPIVVGFILFGSALLTGVLVARRRAVGATLGLVFMEGLLWFGGVWDLANGHYIPLFAPMLGCLLTYSAAIASSYRREWESNLRADASVSALARGGGLMALGRERQPLVEVICQATREVLDARDVFLVLQDEAGNVIASSGNDGLPSLGSVAEQILRDRAVVLWTPTLPQPAQKSRVRSSSPGNKAFDLSIISESSGNALGVALEKLRGEIAHVNRQKQPRRAATSLVAAPLLGSAAQPGETSAPHVRGVLLATGRRNGQSFTTRDASLLQTLAEQAVLALDNLGYYELLQGRVELANRNLRSAYDVLSQERSELAQERTKLAAAVESMESALIISDENHCAVFENGMISRVLDGLSLPAGKSVPETLQQHSWHELAALFAQIEAHPDQKATIESTHLLDRGADAPPGRIILSAQLTPLVASGESRLGSMLVVTDVTAERELEQMKADFVSFVAHELRTPLTSINGFAALMKLSSLHFSEAERMDMLDSIEGQCVRLNRLISDLLEVARLEPGHGIELRIQEVNLVALCQKVISQLRVLISDPEKLNIEMRCEADQLWLGADPDRLEQVLINLISNAIKYSPDGGTVTLELRNGPNDQLTVDVSDTGMGMTAEQVAYLFQKFYRASDAQTRGIQGTGLGLYLVKQLVEAHQGTIEARSAPGEGTTFTVMLPTTLTDEEI